MECLLAFENDSLVSKETETTLKFMHLLTQKTSKYDSTFYSLSGKLLI